MAKTKKSKPLKWKRARDGAWEYGGGFVCGPTHAGLFYASAGWSFDLFDTLEKAKAFVEKEMRPCAKTDGSSESQSAELWRALSARAPRTRSMTSVGATKERCPVKPAPNRPVADKDFEEMARTWLRSMPSHGSGPFNESGASYRARLVPSLAKAFRKAYEDGYKDRDKQPRSSESV